MLELFEEFYPGQITIYHRTRSIDNIKKIMDEGLNIAINFSSRYGRGLYACYDIESQLSQGMEKYGNILVKFAVKKTGRAVILDQVSGNSLTNIRKVLGDFIKDDTELDNFVLDIKEAWEKDGITSNIAYDLSKKYAHEMDVLVFTGKRDGKVAVVYNKNILSPMAYSKIEDNQTTKFEKIPLSLFNKNTLHKKISSERSNKSFKQLMAIFLSGTRDLTDEEKQNFEILFDDIDRIEEELRDLTDENKLKIVKHFIKQIGSTYILRIISTVKNEDIAFEMFNLLDDILSRSITSGFIDGKLIDECVDEKLLKRIMIHKKEVFEKAIVNKEYFLSYLWDKMDVELVTEFKDSIGQSLIKNISTIKHVPENIIKILVKIIPNIFSEICEKTIIFLDHFDYTYQRLELCIRFKSNIEKGLMDGNIIGEVRSLFKEPEDIVKFVKIFRKTIAKIYTNNNSILSEIAPISVRKEILNILDSDLKECYLEKRLKLANEMI